MFGFGGPSTKKLSEKIVNQIIGFQSVMFRLSYEELGIPKKDISRLEITYYSMSLVTMSVLYLSKHKNKMEAVEKAQLDALKTSLASSGSGQSFSAAVKKYQERFSQYEKVFGDLVHGTLKEPEIILATLFVDAVSNSKASMPPYLTALSIFSQGVTDNLEFAKNVL